MLETHQVASDAPANMRPGEFIHYYANLLTLFRNRYAVSEIRDMAYSSVSVREMRIDEFARRLENAQAFFDSTRGERRLAPHLRGWNLQRIRSLRQQHGGLLLAVFHFGEHRHILSDLCCLGLPFVAPVAKRSYFDSTAVFSNGPGDCAEAPLMLEVESRQVGRNLLTALKRGRIGLIYVDGNMGPDGHLVEESGSEIEFFGRRIRVKSGIARLAAAMRLPILPMLAVPDPDNPGVAHELLAMPEILPFDTTSAVACTDEHRIRRIMQECYDGLAAAVAVSPQHWEFAFCLHRWLCTDAREATPPVSVSHPLNDSRRISVDPTMVIPYPSSDGVYWLHVERQRAYRLPDWSDELYGLLQDGPRDVNEVVSHLLKRAGVSPEPSRLLSQMQDLELIQS